MAVSPILRFPRTIRPKPVEEKNFSVPEQKYQESKSKFSAEVGAVDYKNIKIMNITANKYEDQLSQGQMQDFRFSLDYVSHSRNALARKALETPSITKIEHNEKRRGYFCSANIRAIDHVKEMIITSGKMSKQDMKLAAQMESERNNHIDSALKARYELLNLQKDFIKASHEVISGVNLQGVKISDDNNVRGYSGSGGDTGEGNVVGTGGDASGNSGNNSGRGGNTNTDLDADLSTQSMHILDFDVYS